MLNYFTVINLNLKKNFFFFETFQIRTHFSIFNIQLNFLSSNRTSIRVFKHQQNEKKIDKDKFAKTLNLIKLPF